MTSLLYLISSLRDEWVLSVIGTDADGNREVGANRNGVDASVGGRAGPRQRMPNIWEGGLSKGVVWSRLVGCSVGGGT